MSTNQKGSREYRNNERAAQERYNVPISKAGRDSIARKMNIQVFRDNHDAIDWGHGPKAPLGMTGPTGCTDEPGPTGPDTDAVMVQVLQWRINHR